MSTEPSAAEERAGEVGVEMAKGMVEKLTIAIDGFPAASPVQKSAIASLVAEGMENYSDEALTK
jgi:hypothetical protein